MRAEQGCALARPRQEGEPGGGLAQARLARAARDALARRLEAAPIERRWSARATLAFILATCGAFWAAVALAILRG